MRNENTFGIHFILRMNKVKNGKAPLHARISVNSSRVEVSLKTFVEVCEWNSSKGLAKPKNDNAKELIVFWSRFEGSSPIAISNYSFNAKILMLRLSKICF